MKNRTFFGYFGGKFYLAKDLIPLFPEHLCYVEVFGGAANVLLQKLPSKVEVYNDLNSDIVNLFRQVRDNCDAFYEKVSLIPYSREERQAFHKALETDLDPLERAVAWYVCATQGFGGHVNMDSWSFTIVRNRAKQLVDKVENLDRIMQRLRRVMIENRSFEFILQSYDSPDTFFYLDPPYLPETRRGGEYGHEMTYEDHEYLLFLLRSIKGKFVLSRYPNELYDAEGWHTKEFEIVSRCAGTTRASGLKGEGKLLANQKRTEKIWCNFPLPEQPTLF